MRKVLLTFLIGCLGFISAPASNTISMDKKATTNRKVDCIVPRPPMYYLTYTPNPSTLTFYIRPVSDPLFAVLQNITTGESFFYSFESSLVAMFQITGEAGLWKISVGRAPRCHNPSILYERFFTIEGDKIIYDDAR